MKKKKNREENFAALEPMIKNSRELNENSRNKHVMYYIKKSLISSEILMISTF